jgi:hypothetical protein
MSKQITELSGGVVREAERPTSVLSHAERSSFSLRSTGGSLRDLIRSN